MATAKEIETVILEIAGNPSVGYVKVTAPVWAEAIANLDGPQVKRGPTRSKPEREVRVVEPGEEREL